MKEALSANTKISDLLLQYPKALDVLLAASPAFHKLKNPVLRKLLAKRVTIDEAAAIGGVNAEALLAAIATACHATITPTQETMKDTAAESSHAEDAATASDTWSDTKRVTLDVRIDLAENRDPFHRIMKTVKHLEPGEVLHLINSFEPVPLYAVLAERGFAHRTEHKNDEWHVYFYTSESAKTEAPHTSDLSAAIDRIIELDVSGLEPPEPMQRILVALGSLPIGATLQVAHHREPLLLYDQLERRGFRWVTEKLGENQYQIQISRSA